ncbi:aminomethyl-transferring glycine dehydrogenase subunit GcvPB [Caldicoprobacter algeriensis]|uniref:aminomethyl-transferring glycine dehydrogenase subunit GcvPB n=1 Tax=Caldicoprobacter algeriensis TaxID=699281 RepID=UPI00207A0F5C|nr:aminomethyl-transferring glycine dehydrogenase subunit GcvPB [Caldicoprobacter algeriensis]
MKERPLIFEMSKSGRKAYSLPHCDVPQLALEEMVPRECLREEDARLPEVSEVDVVRHFTRLSQLNYGVDSGFYPLGSCTMKYNPKVNEDVAALAGFTQVHPLQPAETVQGCLEILYRMDRLLSEITGMDRFSLQPAAGAHGEMTGLMIIKAYHQHRGDVKRNKIIVPDSAHGTNPASAAMVGFDVVEVKSNDRGEVDLEALKAVVDDTTAGLMLTNPNTLGLFEGNILEIANIVHKAGGLLYYDGANMNAILGIARPGDMGFDVVHLNLHKTFSTPHGGGGPGSGPVGVKKELEPFLPVPMVGFKDGRYYLDYDRPLSIGRVKSFYGNFGVVVKAYAYIMSMGAEGLKRVSESAVLNANYLMERLKEHYLVPYNRRCMHEFVISAQRQKEKGVSALDIAKRLMDFGFHPPTMYFPLIVKEALMIEPTETESKETLDAFADALIEIAREVEEQPEKVKGAPHTTPVRRLDEAKAARNPVLRWNP